MSMFLGLGDSDMTWFWVPASGVDWVSNSAGAAEALTERYRGLYSNDQEHTVQRSRTFPLTTRPKNSDFVHGSL